MKPVKLDHVKIGKGIDHVVATDDAERFHISSSKNNADVITIDGFEFGVDTLHYGKNNATDTVLSWADSDGDGQSDDLQMVMGGQTVILTDLAQQIETPVVHRYEQDFETDAGAWNDSGDSWYGTATQVASGTGGIASASGNHHAVLEGDADGNAPHDSFMNAGAVPFEPYTASISIYLDPQADGGSGWADGEGFEYSVAASNAADGHLRDFVFHVTQDTSTGDMIVDADNNAYFQPREDLETISGTEVIEEDGWYTFEHRFYENGAGDLAVDMVVLDEADQIVFSETRTDPADDIANVNGEPRYGWFTEISVDQGLPVDDLTITYPSDQVPPLPDADDLQFV